VSVGYNRSASIFYRSLQAGCGFLAEQSQPGQSYSHGCQEQKKVHESGESHLPHPWKSPAKSGNSESDTCPTHSRSENDELDPPQLADFAKKMEDWEAARRR
jgi:hypothetical protein